MSYVNLIQLCEPVFDYVCKLNRISRNGGQIDYHVLRGEVQDLLDQIRKEASKDSKWGPLFERIEVPLICFIDYTIINSGMQAAEEWEDNRLAYDYSVLSGDEEFFDMMEEMEADSSDEASECLVVFFTCIGLGLAGIYADSPEILKQRMERVRPRIRKYIESDPNARIVPSCYQHTDTSDLVEPPGSKLLGIAIVFLGLFAVVFAAVFLLFDQAVGDLNRSVDTIIRQDPAAMIDDQGEL